MEWGDINSKVWLAILILLIALILIIWWSRGHKSIPSSNSQSVSPKEQGVPDGSVESELNRLRLTACSQQFGSPLDCMRLQSLEKSTDFPGFGESNFDVVLCSKQAVEIDNTQMTSIYMVRNQLKLNCFSSSVVFTYGTDKLHNGIYTFRGVNNAWSNVMAGVAMVTVNGEQKIYSYKSRYDLSSDSLTLFIEDSSSNVITLKGSVVITLILTDCVSNVATGAQGNNFTMITGGTNTMSRG